MFVASVRGLSVWGLVAWLLCMPGWVSAVTVTVHNATAFPAHVRWNFGIFGSEEKMVPALGEVAVSKGILVHTGFQDVYLLSARVGDVWGKDPNTGVDLVFTEAMIDKNGHVRGVQPPHLYHAPVGQALYHHFLLLIEPVETKKGNGVWVPRLRINRLDKDIFVQIKNKIAGFFTDVGDYGSEGIAILHALAQHKPITGFMLTKDDLARRGYVAQSQQPSPPSLAQERQNITASIDALARELGVLAGGGQQESDEYRQKEQLKQLYEEELAILDAIVKYRPIVYLHPDDLARPVDPRDFFAGETTGVRQGTHTQQTRAGFFMQKGGAFTIPVGQTTFRKLSELTQEHPTERYYVWHGTPTHPEQYDRRIFYGSNPANYADGAVPMHVVTFYDRIPAGVDEKGNVIYQKDENGYYVPNKEFFYIQYLFLYGYNQPYDISVPLGTVYRGDVHDFQNAHEGDLEHLTMKMDTKTGKPVAIFYGSHGSNEGMWMYPPGSTGKAVNEFTVEDGRPVVYVARGGHGNYPKEGVYTRVYGLANDHTKKGQQWRLTEDSLFRTVRPISAGFNPFIHSTNPDYYGYLDWRGFLGHRGVTSFREKAWASNSEGEDKGRDAVVVHQKHFCPATHHDVKAGPAHCVRDKSKASPPPGDKKPWYIDLFQTLGII